VHARRAQSAHPPHGLTPDGPRTALRQFHLATARNSAASDHLATVSRSPCRLAHQSNAQKVPGQ